MLSAGCGAALDRNLNVSRDLGTRHRAGIGVSEHSDAVVAIVSEETGAISVAVGGMLKRHLSLETLERLLRKRTDSFGGTGRPENALVCIPASEEGGR